MNDDSINKVLSVCLALTAQRDRETLLSTILETGMDIAHCDAGTLYLLEEDGLHFCRMFTRSQNIYQGGHADPIKLPPVPLEEKYVSSWVALHNTMINVADVRTDQHFDFTGSLRYDAMTGYRTKSMLVVPMSNDKGELLGVMQLINALDENGETVPFDPESELLISAITSQAALSIVNMQYAEQVTALLDSLVGALSSAIDQRSPYNAHHTRNMVRIAEAFLDDLAERQDPHAFDENRRRAFLMSIWLHDVGKLTVPLEIMDKESRLGPSIYNVLERLRVIGLLARIAYLEGKLPRDTYEHQSAELSDARELIERINSIGFLPDDDLAAVLRLGEKTFVNEDGVVSPWLTKQELQQLSVRKGTLTDEEREIMQNHVVLTSKILSHVAFPKMYSAVPLWAGEHHELLNGKGYPSHLTAAQIPTEVRLLTILDVFEALTACDRPYKPPMPVEKALSILHSMVDEGALDPELLTLFEQSRAWERVVNTGSESKNET